MGGHVQKRLVAVSGDLDEILLLDVLAVGSAAQHLIHDLDPDAQFLAPCVQRGGGVLFYCDQAPAVLVVRQTGARRGGHGRHLCVLPRQLHPRVLQTGVVRRVPLLRRQHRRILALGLVRLDAVQPRVVHAGKSRIQGGRVLCRPAHFLIRLLPVFQKAAYALLCAFLRSRGWRCSPLRFLRHLAACKPRNVPFYLADRLVRVQLHAGALLQHLHCHRVAGDSRRLIAGDGLAPRHSLHRLRRLGVDLRRGVPLHITLVALSVYRIR